LLLYAVDETPLDVANQHILLDSNSYYNLAPSLATSSLIASSRITNSYSIQS
jgi:hypothetical protein